METRNNKHNHTLFLWDLSVNVKEEKQPNIWTSLLSHDPISQMLFKDGSLWCVMTSLSPPDSPLPHRRRSPTSTSISISAVKMLPSSPSPHSLLRRSLSLSLFFLAASLSCFLLYHSSDSLHFLSSSSPFPYLFSSFHDAPPELTEEDKLRMVLEKAAMEDKTVILTTLNQAWAVPYSVLDLFLESFRIGNGTEGLLRHLVIICLDEEAYKRCLIIHPHCYALVTEGVDFSLEAYFMTNDYLKMMWRRIKFLSAVLEMGYNFIFTDADIMWFRNPFPRFYLDADFQIACDHFTGSSDDVENSPNGGFNYVKANNRSIEFYKFWYSSQDTYPGKHDQDVLNLIKSDPILEDIGLKMKFLDTKYFGGLCEPSRDLNAVCTMHANCCFGMDSKLIDLKIMLQDWKLYQSLPPSFKKAAILSWRVPYNCSVHSRRQITAPAKNESQV